VEGAIKGSDYLIFDPGQADPGFYYYDIKTAGSAPLLLQTVYLPLTRCDDTSFVKVRGGTHVAWSPTSDYLIECWQPMLAKIGLSIDIEVVSPGFYPQGGGEMAATISPSSGVKPIRLLEKGRHKKTKCKITISKLKMMIADRMEKRCGQILRGAGIDPEFEVLSIDAVSQGVALALIGEFESIRCCFTALGERGKRAEAVAEEGCRKYLDFLGKRAALDQYMADQILLPLSQGVGESQFTTTSVTEHLLTNIRTIERFLEVKIEIDGELGEEGRVSVKR
jgi:RNA 3'-terminal phosphate cyclase (ATP)